MARADHRERISRFAPCGARGPGVAQGTRCLTELTQQVRVEQAVFRSFCFVQSDAERREALVESAAAALDRRTTLERSGGGEMIAARGRLLEGEGAG